MTFECLKIKAGSSALTVADESAALVPSGASAIPKPKPLAVAVVPSLDAVVPVPVLVAAKSPLLAEALLVVATLAPAPPVTKSI
jgi:hypothetical protein